MAAVKLFENLELSCEDTKWKISKLRGDSAEMLIDYIILAEFDIDTGSTVRHQYPKEIPGYKPDWFAEHMLPEGAHNREQDWTYMLLNRSEKQLDEFYWLAPSVESDEIVEDPSKRLLYGINLVFNKADSSVRRGAVVKSLAIFSRYHFVEIFRTPLLITLNRYYSDPSISVLKELYEAFNSLSLENCPRPNIIEQNLMRWGVSHTFPSSTMNHRSILFETSNTSNTFQQQQQQQNNLTLETYFLVDYTPFKWYYTDTITLFENISQPLHIPLYTTPDDLGISNLTYLIKIFRESTMKIYHAILMKKRVLFVGYDHAAGDVCQMTLSAVSMIAPPMVNVIRRVFPYANLSDLSFLEVPGYIAGVTNPMFQQHDSWFDLLCILDLPNKRGVVQTAEERRVEEAAQKGKPYTSPTRSSEESLHESADLKFILSVLSGIDAKLGEEWVRGQFFEYTQAILSDAFEISRRSSSLGRMESFDLPSHAMSAPSTPTHHLPHSPELISGLSYSSSSVATATSTMTRHPIAPLTRGGSGLQQPPPLVISGHNGSSVSLPVTLIDKVKKRMEANRYRLRTLLSSSEFNSLPPSPWAWAEYQKSQYPLENEENMTISGDVLHSQIRRLQTESNLDEIEIEAIYSILVRGLTSESSLQAVLSLLPFCDYGGGLHLLGVGLFHSNSRIRAYAGKLLKCFMKYSSTKSIYESMNQFYKYAIERNEMMRRSEGGERSGNNNGGGRNGSMTR